MADTVKTIVILQTPTHYVVNLKNISDGTGESAVVKVDKSTLTNATDDAEAGSLDIERAEWSCEGMQARLYWDHTTDDLALICAGNGRADFKGKLGDVPGLMSTPGLKDPRSVGATGDILLTTVGHSSGDTYDITLWLRKNPD